MNDLAVGASYTNTASMTFNLEYHFHEAGFSSRDWSNWFNASARLGAIPGVNNALVVFAFLRAGPAGTDVATCGVHAVGLAGRIVKDLELTALATVNLQDASWFAQATAEYHLSRAWTVAGTA